MGLQFTQFLMALSGGYLWSVLGLIAIAAVILGMGLPVTAAYIVLSIMAVPSLTELGVGLLAAHMIVFWLSQTSNVTPPIALAAFAAAGIANTSPMKSAVQAFKLAQGFFIIPIMMAFSGLIWMEGENIDFAVAIVLTIGLIVAFAGCIEGRLATKLPVVYRILLLVSAFAMLVHYPYINVIGLVLIVMITLLNIRTSKSERVLTSEEV
ncbi:TRAP transporter large permease subunit [Psychromonas sp. GE-S-Ul-11]|uniref:TRAP transporter large permease subunit n=1 Tax=Psychromonas sp. GE-S-Ul-11 TaxID=3241170 RepID=UPI00390C7016